MIHRSRYWMVLVLLATSHAVADAPVRFTSVDVFIESSEPVAAWQLEFAASNNAMQVVGVENGDSRAFDGPPYYDREAVEQGRADRIVIADYSLEDESLLPSGRIRVATVHVMLSGDAEPEFDTRLIVATSYRGSRVNAEIDSQVSDGSEQ